jgi:hypothetical protein
MTQAERTRARRARAQAAGLCRTCCTAKPVVGFANCARCIESQRRWRAQRSGVAYVPIYTDDVVRRPRRVRRSPAALIIHGESKIQRITRENRLRKGIVDQLCARLVAAGIPVEGYTPCA